MELAGFQRGGPGLTTPSGIMYDSDNGFLIGGLLEDVSNILAKLHVNDRTEAVSIVIKRGIVHL